MDGAVAQPPDFDPDVSLGPSPDPNRTGDPVRERRTGDRRASAARALAGGPGGLRRAGPIDPSIRRTWWLLAGSFLLLAFIAGARVALEREALDWLVLLAVVV